jgi:N-acyl-D-aspartate/D-glutamate deacylase
MEFDLVVRNGLVVDGTGEAGRQGDVAIVGDRIVAVGDVDGGGREEIDADGLVVAPGFVDGHTHMDAQVFWDELGTSSCWHGVTTVAMGNCGFSLAPATYEDRAMVVRNLERAEDIAGEAMEAGITWTWSTFAEYLDAVEARPKGINYTAAIGHSALRTWAMGERAFEQAASEDDLVVMERELSDALRAGAAGFTTSRSFTHVTPDERPVASRLATWDEIVALVSLMGRESTGIFELAGEGRRDDDPAARAEYYGRLQRLALSSGVAISFGLFASAGSMPSLTVIEDTVAKGGQMYGLTHCRGVNTVQSFRTRVSFDALPEWQDVRRRPLDEQRTLLRDPDVRKRLVYAAQHGNYGDAFGPEARKPDYDDIYVMYSPYLPNPTVAEEARRLGVDPVDAMIDIALERDFDIFFLQVLTKQADDDLVRLLRNPNTAMTFSDAGAHVSQVADASIQSHLLAYWVRERQEFTLEEAVRMITHQPAAVWRLHDRGRLAPGYAADLTIFDADTVAPRMPELVEDLPGGARRLVQRADGYAATIVNGEVVMRDGEAGEARPGRVLRAGQLPVPA